MSQSALVYNSSLLAKCLSFGVLLRIFLEIERRYQQLAIAGVCREAEIQLRSVSTVEVDSPPLQNTSFESSLRLEHSRYSESSLDYRAFTHSAREENIRQLIC